MIQQPLTIEEPTKQPIANDSDYASPIKDEVTDAEQLATFYNSNDDMKDGVNEMIEDEAFVA